MGTAQKTRRMLLAAVAIFPPTQQPTNRLIYLLLLIIIVIEIIIGKKIYIYICAPKPLGVISATAARTEGCSDARAAGEALTIGVRWSPPGGARWRSPTRQRSVNG